MKLNISLIVSTYGRYTELELLFESFLNQDCDHDIFEVIVIDQNDIINLDTLVKNYKSKINITHYKTNVKGLSKAKNKGIELAKGSILTFPDDDCTFYPDTISKMINFFSKNPEVDVVYGSVFDRENNKDIMRNWSKYQIKLNLMNYSLNYSAITCFTKLKIRFDENYGVGSKISSGEELDYVIRAIAGKHNVVYSPRIQVWHPELNVESMNNTKVYNYAYGYAAIMRKNCNIPLFLVFITSLSYQLTRFMLSLFTKNREKYFLAVKGRLNGFLLLDK
jgi:glycosyltransferase involved in cell wall biosynthesis